MTSLFAYFIILGVLTASTLIWYAKLSFESRSLRILISMLLVSTQILVEIFITFKSSPIRLSAVPYLHFLVLAIIVISTRSKLRTYGFNFKSFTKPQSTGTRFAFVVSRIQHYWYLPMIAAALSIGAYPALLGGPSTVDERAYHWPQILGIVQNNGFITFDSSLPWTYTYPLGKAMFSSFTWPFVETDLAFRSIQIFLGLIAILSIYALGKNFSQKTGIFSALIFAASPIFAVLVRMSSDDLGYGAFTLASVALLIQANISSNTSENRKYFILGLLSFAMCGQFKFAVVSTLLVSPLVIIYLIKHRSKIANLFMNLALITISVIIGFIYSIRNFINYGNPFYPLNIKVGHFQVFSGPLVSINSESIRPSTTFNLEEPFRYMKIWHATFFDFFQKPNEDSLGSYHYLVGILLISMFVYNLTQIRKLIFAYRVLLVSSFLTLILVSGLFLPRLGFFTITILSIFAIRMLAPLFLSKKINAILGIFAIIGLLPIIFQNSEAKNWVQSQSGGASIYKNGQSHIDQKFDLASDGTVLPARSVKWIQDNVSYKESVCYSAATNYPSSYWNLQRTSIVRYTPISESDRYPNSNNKDKFYSRSKLKSWLKNIDTCDYVITYDSIGSLNQFSTNWKKNENGSSSEISMYMRVDK